MAKNIFPLRSMKCWEPCAGSVRAGRVLTYAADRSWREDTLSGVVSSDRTSSTTPERYDSRRSKSGPHTDIAGGPLTTSRNKNEVSIFSVYFYYFLSAPWGQSEQYSLKTIRRV